MEYVIVAVVVAAIIVIFVLWGKKTQKRQASRMKMLSQEQFDHIKNFGYSPYNNDKSLLKTVGVLTNVKEGPSSSASVDFIYYNCCTERYELGDSKISRDVIKNRPLNVGDYIEIVFKFKDGFIEGIKEIL